MALNDLLCADVPLRTYTLAHLLLLLLLCRGYVYNKIILKYLF